MENENIVGNGRNKHENIHGYTITTDGQGETNK